MFKISLKDVGPDRVTRDVTFDSSKLEKAVGMGYMLVGEVLNTDSGFVLVVQKEDIVVKRNGNIVGSMTITRLR